jgi:hypothetical protein
LIIFFVPMMGGMVRAAAMGMIATLVRDMVVETTGIQRHRQPGKRQQDTGRPPE